MHSLRHRLLLSLALVLGLSLFGAAQTWQRVLQQANLNEQVESVQSSATKLEVGATIAREIAGEQPHSYRFAMTTGQFVHLVITQRTTRVVILLRAPDGQKVEEMDSPDDLQWPYRLRLIAEVSGPYVLEIRATEKTAPAGRYEVQIAELRASTGQDKDRVAAGHLFGEGLRLRNEKTPESNRKAIEKYVAALPLWRAAGDRVGEADTLRSLGNVYFELGEKEKNIDVLNALLALRRWMSDRAGEASTLNSFGVVYYSSGETQKALDVFSQALAVERAEGDQDPIASTLSNICLAHIELGSELKALDFCNQALVIKRTTGDKRGEAVALNRLGSAYISLGEPQKALDAYTLALTIDRVLSNRREEAYTLNKLGDLYGSLGQNQKALGAHEQALSIWRALGNRQGEAVTLTDIGIVQNELGEQQKALDY